MDYEKTIETIEPNTLWRRKSGSFTHLVYEVVSHNDGIVYYRIYGQRVTMPFPDYIFLRDFERLSDDEVLAITGGII